MKLKHFSLCIALMFADNALAADTTVATLPNIEVIGKRIQPLPSMSNPPLGENSVLRLRSASSDTATMLRDIPGINLYGAGGVSSLPGIHGLSDDRLRIKVDGMDLISACANHMNPPLSYIDPSKIGNVEVFAGITPVSLGGDSIGGTIQVNSPQPEFASYGKGMLLKGEVGSFYRSNGNANGGNISATVASENLSMTYNSSIAQSGNYSAAKDFKNGGAPAVDKGDAWMGGAEVGSSRYQSRNHSLAFALRLEKHLIDLKLAIQDIPYEGFPSQSMDMTGNDSKQVNLRYLGEYQWGVLETRVYKEKTVHKMNFGYDKNFYVEGMPMDTVGKTTGAVVKADIPVSERDTLRVGGEYQRYRLNDWWDAVGSGMMAPNPFININNGGRDRYALFTEWEGRWNDQWISQLGVRNETVLMNAGPVHGYRTTGTTSLYVAESTTFNTSNRQRTDNNWDMTALTRYTPNDMQTFEAGYAMKTRSPNLYERYTWSTGGMAMAMNNLTNDGNAYVGNLDLKPEVAHTFSATADWHDAAREEWGLKITPYYTYVNNYIDAQRCSGNTNCTTTNTITTTQFVQLQYINQSARLYGFDISGHLPLAKSGDYGNFTATGLLNYTNGRNTRTKDDLYNIMPLNAKVAMVHELGNLTNTVEVEMVDKKRTSSQVRNEMRTGGYGLLNLRSSYELKQVRFDFGLENALDKFYALPLGGAYVGQGSTMSINTAPYGTPVPGMGRSAYLGVTWKF